MNNAELLKKMISVALNAKFKEIPPTEEELIFEANNLREATKVIYFVNEDEYNNVLKELKAEMVVIMDDGIYISDSSNPHQSWLPAKRAETDFYYWNRYKRYLEEEKGWNAGLTAKLDKTSDEIIDLIGDPNEKVKGFQRRGLVLGDVQSGKTANYTAICNKAADCGYKVIIVLAGMMENLRVQTQQRLDAEFAGRKSKNLLDPKVDQQIKNTPFGVGKIPPVNMSKRIACFTSVNTDFNQIILKSNDLTLINISETAIFVVKKNKRILNNLHSWLLANNADTANKIALPLLLIDDEADNASVNTKKEDEDPTAINAAIRNILNSFYQASYMGITATPFANIFINPETEDGVPDDLFPKDFIYSLSPPSNYIGADAIFGSGKEQNWRERNEAPYAKSVLKIYNQEMENFFPFKHKKDIDVDDLPPSMYEAIGFFMLVNAIRDVRGDLNEHRSMLINVSRFTDIQTSIGELINEFLIKVRSDLGNYAKYDVDKSLQISSIKFLYAIWNKYSLQDLAKCEWLEFQQRYLYKAVSPIEVVAVNQKTGSASLNYSRYSDKGFRVIAVGGNSLSRGLTLEGLCVSYFYRNSIMYDTLLQMGRWFGYRKNYDDIFKIWMAEEAVDWYGYITDVSNELRLEIAKMKAQNQTPAEFGLKVRQDPNSLIATARNKMRTATSVTRPITVSGRLLETPRLKNNIEILKRNENVFRMFVSNLDSVGQKIEIPQNAHFWTGVPKELVVSLVRSFDTHPWHLAFQSKALSDYIEDDDELTEWDVAIPNGSSRESFVLNGAYSDIVIMPAERFVAEGSNMIRISGTKVKVGAGGSTRIGLTQSQIENAEKEFTHLHPGKSKSDSTYLVKGRKPILMLHIIKCKPEEGQKLSADCPKYLFALGLGFPNTGKAMRTANYVVNINELKNWVDIVEDGGDDEDDI